MSNNDEPFNFAEFVKVGLSGPPQNPLYQEIDKLKAAYAEAIEERNNLFAYWKQAEARAERAEAALAKAADLLAVGCPADKPPCDGGDEDCPGCWEKELYREE